MYLLTMPIDPDEAISRMKEILGMTSHPERLAQKINASEDFERVKSGIEGGSFDPLTRSVEKLKKFIDLETEIANVKAGKWAFGFMGKSFAEKKIKGLLDERRKIGSLIDAPQWFYSHDRVWLLNCLRDYVLTMSAKGESRWIDQKDCTFKMPLLEMFENGDVAKAKAVAKSLGGSIDSLDPFFVLNELEGNSVINFDLKGGTATYFVPVRQNQ